MDLFAQNVLYSILLIVSGVIILSTLKHFKMYIARALFMVLFAITLIYIPFYFGGNALFSWAVGTFKDQSVARIFIANVQGILNTPFALFQSVTVGMAVFSVLLLVAAIITAVALTAAVVEFIQNCLQHSTKTHKDVKRIVLRVLRYVNNSRFLYKRLERYLN